MKNLALDHVRRFDQRFTDPLDDETDLPEGDDKTYTDAVALNSSGACATVRRLPVMPCVFVLKRCATTARRMLRNSASVKNPWKNTWPWGCNGAGLYGEIHAGEGDWSTDPWQRGDENGNVIPMQNDQDRRQQAASGLRGRDPSGSN